MKIKSGDCSPTLKRPPRAFYLKCFLKVMDWSYNEQFKKRRMGIRALLLGADGKMTFRLLVSLPGVNIGTFDSDLLVEFRTGHSQIEISSRYLVNS
ncbi:hypothetical protein CDAR_441881 [Caerostris darwini]|uniref:Uncharacterized protein n=1 Tax=Caerostris darwini TaxID=1538125 RepID=A0AAV4VYV8_9ARAC|nr:hypothetical protein CDAR_441881 [Caerostris darwini]